MPVRRRCARCGVSTTRKDLTFHRFPPANERNFERIQKWAQWCFPEEDWSDFNKVKSLYLANYLLCGQHFSKGYIYSGGRLCKNAIPSLDPTPVPVPALKNSSTVRRFRRKRNVQKKCAKCGITSAQDSTLTFHRFPGGDQFLRAQAWIEYAIDNKVRKNWSSTKQVVGFYNKRMVLCSKHFDDDAFTSNSKKKLNEFAVPLGAEHIYAGLLARKKKMKKGERNFAEDVRLTEHNYAKTGRQDNDSYTTTTNHHSNSDDAAAIVSENMGSDDTQAEVLQEDEVEVKQEQTDLSSVCRVCLRYFSDARDMTPLLCDGKLTDAANALTAFSPQIRISANDNLPMQICDVCAREAIRAERFYRRVEETHARLATLAPHDIVQYSLSLKRYFPESNVANKLGEDDETAVISLTYDGDQNLELCFNNQSSSHEVVAATAKLEGTSDESQYEGVFMEADEDVTQLLEMEDVSVKDEPIFDANETSLAQNAASVSEMNAECDQLSPGSITDVDTTFRCSECHTDFVTCLEAEHHMRFAHDSVPAYVCHECSQTVATKQLLREHLRRHSGVKPYECQRCRNKFYSQGDLRRHSVMCAVRTKGDIDIVWNQ